MRKRFLSILLAALMMLSTVLTLVPATANETDTTAPEETTTLTLDDLYVKGATFMWDAFDMKSTDEVITVFENKVGDTDVTLPVTVTMGNGYILYPQTNAQGGTDAKGNFSLSAFLPKATYTVGEASYTKATDYSLEMTVHQYTPEGFVPYTTDADRRIQYFGETSNINGQLQRLFFTYNTDSTTYAEKGFLSAVKFSPYSTTFGSKWNQTAISSAFLNGLEKPYTIGVNWDFSFDDTAVNGALESVDGTFTINSTRDGATNAGTTYGSKLSVYSGAYLNFGGSAPFAYYAIRVYPFALTAEQSAQNHFAELANYFKIGEATLAEIASLDDETKLALYTGFNGKTFEDYENAEALEAAILNVCTSAKKAALMAMYDSLYVENPIYLWDAYSYTEDSEDVTAFTSSVGDTALSLSGTPYDRYVRSTSALSFTSILPKTEDGANADFTVEVVAKQIWDDEFAAVVKTGQHYTSGTGYLLRRWADSRMEITTKTPTYDEANGAWADGFINTVPVVYINAAGKTSAWGSDAWLSAKIGEAYSFGASFEFDHENEVPQFHVQLLRDGAILKETDHKYNAANNKFGITDAKNIICMGYYAIRAYDRVLKQGEMTQNHFADLVKYFDIGEDAFHALNELDAEQKKALFSSFADVTFDETTKDGVIAAISAAKSNITSAFLTDNEIFLFDGYSSRLYVDPAIRASFTVDTTKLTVDGVTVLEMGTLSAMKGERALANLTVAEKDGAYAPIDADVAHNVIYKGGEFIGKIGEDGKLTAHQIVSFDAETATKDDYNVEYLFRGYAVVEVDGACYVLYTDMTSALFGEEISMYELASDRNVAMHELNKDVTNVCIKNPEKKTFRMLAIGNSFSLNSTYHLYDIAKNQGYEDIVIGVLYIGGCSIKKHATNALTTEKAYEYHKYVNSARATTEKTSLTEGLLDEPWDFIVTHQASHLAGTAESYTDGLADLVEYVQENATNDDVKLYWTITWAYALSHTHYKKNDAGFEFLSDQDEYDHRISSHTKTAVLPLGCFDGIIPSGKAIRNAREYYGYDISDNGLYSSPDGYHLSARGQLISALTWFAAITGEDISDCTVKVQGMAQEDIDANISAVQDALLDPFYTKD